MSMAVVLKRVRDHLRESLTLAPDQCAIAPDGLLPATASELFVGVDEQAVKSSSREQLQELFEIEVSVWRRASAYPRDRLGDALLADDPHLAVASTLDALEREIIRNVHGNFADITAAANAELNAGSPDGGDIFQLAFYYGGRGKTKRVAGSDADDWLCRRLVFAGMLRVQAMDVMR